MSTLPPPFLVVNKLLLKTTNIIGSTAKKINIYYLQFGNDPSVQYGSRASSSAELFAWQLTLMQMAATHRYYTEET